jgi:predicted ester cyclase
MVEATRNRRVVEEFVEAFNRHDREAASLPFARDCLNHGRVAGPEGLRAVLDDIFTRFPDIELTPLTWVVEGEWVTVRCTYGGTHRGVGRLPVDGGMLIGVPPTHRSFTVQHIHMFRLGDGKITEHWANRDDVDMMRQLGLVPPPAMTEP